MEFDPLGILGRKWSTASKAETRELSDCVRVTLTWLRWMQHPYLRIWSREQLRHGATCLRFVDV